MERGEFRSFSSPPDFPSSSSFFSATVPAVWANEEEVLYASSSHNVKNKLTPSKATSTLPGPSISPSPCPDSGGSSSSSSPFLYTPAQDLTSQRLSTGICSSSTADCLSRPSYSPSLAVRSRASITVSNRVDYEDVHVRPVASAAHDGLCMLPSHHSQPATASKCLGNKQNGTYSAHISEYFSAGEEEDFTPVLPRYQKHFPLNASSRFDVSLRRGYTVVPNTENAQSANVTVSTHAAHQQPLSVPRSITAAGSSAVSLLAGGGTDFQASTAEQLSKYGAPLHEHGGYVWQQQWRRREEEAQQQQQQRQGSLRVQQQWKDRLEEPQQWRGGLQQEEEEQQQQREGPRTVERRLPRQFQLATASRLPPRASASQQQSVTSDPPDKSAEVQQLLERMRMFHVGSFNAAAASKRDALPCGGGLNGGDTSAEGVSSARRRRRVHARPCCAENFRSAALCTRQPLCSSGAAGEEISRGHQEPQQHQQRREQQVSKKDVQKKRGQAEVKTKTKRPRDRRIVVVCALLFLDVIIIGSTSTQHALNPASLVDKVLLTHVSFSASLCSLSAGSAAAVAECLASASGNAAAAAAASSVAAGNSVEERTGLQSRLEEARQQTVVPQVQQQLLREPYLLPHYERYLPHSLKRELGLSCVCGWAALVVLGILCLWVAVRDTSLAARVFPAVTPPTSETGMSTTDRDEDRSTVNDSSSIASCSREGLDTGSSAYTSSRSSSRCSGRTRGKEELFCACNHVAECCGTTFFGATCSSTSRSSRTLCVCGTCSSRRTNVVSSSSSSSGFVDRFLCPCRRRKAASGCRRGDVGSAAAAAAAEGGRLGSGRRRRRGLVNMYSTETAEYLRDYEETVLREYQARIVIEARARLFYVSLLALLIFFGMNFIVQLNVRCHRTKYHLYTLQSLAAAAQGNGATSAAADAGRSSSSEESGPKPELPTTPNTPLLPLKLLLHAQQPAAASSAFYFGGGGEQEVQEEQQHDNGEEGTGQSEAGGQHVEKRGRSYNRQEPPTSPAYVYYRDYQFWYQLFADSCRDAEMQLSVAWIVLHITAVISCKNMMREAEEHVRGALRTFRRRYEYV